MSRNIIRRMELELRRRPGLLRTDCDDFKVQNVSEILEWGTPLAQYVWTVGAHGSTLTRLGADAAHCTDGIAALDLMRGNVQSFLISADRVDPISRAVAIGALSRPQEYVIVDSHVAKACGRLPLARWRLVWEGGWARARTATVHFEPIRPLTVDDLAALRLVARSLVVQDSGDMLTVIDEIYVDHRPLAEVFATARARGIAAPRRSH